jgi:hypothetical protein
MPRPRRAVPARRYHVTLDRAIADRLTAYAQATHRPAATAAASLIGDGLTRLDGDDPGELREARRQVAELTRRVESLRRQLAERTGREQVEHTARWEWPIDALLADTDWWDRWLPRFNELMGRGSAFAGRSLTSELVTDERGYTDLLGFLFPAIGSDDGELTWRSLAYSEEARRRLSTSGSSVPTSRAADVWQPVIRLVAEALCLLETTGQAGVDPYLRLRARAEIAGLWAQILAYLVGEKEHDLPRHRLV